MISTKRADLANLAHFFLSAYKRSIRESAGSASRRQQIAGMNDFKIRPRDLYLIMSDLKSSPISRPRKAGAYRRPRISSALSLTTEKRSVTRKREQARAKQQSACSEQKADDTRSTAGEKGRGKGGCEQFLFVTLLIRFFPHSPSFVHIPQHMRYILYILHNIL